jgi:hypothetical protein
MVKVRDVKGRKVGIIQVELSELIDMDFDSLGELFSRRLLGHDRLVDLDYHIAGHVRDMIYLEVSGVEEPEHVGATEDLLNQIAADILHIETLKTRGNDRLDFHDLSVMSIREALAAAYEAGRLATGKG